MARRILGFNENDHTRVSRAVKRVEAMRDARNRRQRRFSGPKLGIPFYNNTNSTAPLGAVMKVVGTTIISGTQYLEIIRPDDYNLHDCVINLTADVGYQQTGLCTYNAAKVFCDEATSLTHGDGLGTYPGYWSVSRGYGFRYIGNQDIDNQTAKAERFGLPGYYNSWAGSPATVSGATYFPHTSTNEKDFGEWFDVADNSTLTFRHSGVFSLSVSGTYGLDTGETIANPPSVYSTLNVNLESADIASLPSTVFQYGYANGGEFFQYIPFNFAITFNAEAGNHLQVKFDAGSPAACVRRYAISLTRVNSF